MDKELIGVKNISKHYAGHTALQNVSFNIPRNCIFGFLGPNGAGKTSLIRIINQITAADSGTITINQTPIQRQDTSKIGYLPEERGLYKKMKVGEQAIYLAQLKGLTKEEAKKRLHYWFKKFEITEWWNKKIEELSKGMAQKIQFITTVVHDPELLILDEPFSGFDPINANLIKKEILELKEKGKTIILSTHNMESVEEICDRIILINKAEKILDGEVKTIKQNFSEGKFEIVFKGNMVAFANAIWGGWELVERHQISENEFKVIIKLDNIKLNQFIKGIIDHVEICAIHPILPSMNEIFIKLVSQSVSEETTTEKAQSI